MKAAKGAREPINARAETVATGPTFKRAYAKRRCLVPADDFYEWNDPPPSVAVTFSQSSPCRTRKGQDFLGRV